MNNKQKMRALVPTNGNLCIVTALCNDCMKKPKKIAQIKSIAKELTYGNRNSPGMSSFSNDPTFEESSEIDKLDCCGCGYYNGIKVSFDGIESKVEDIEALKSAMYDAYDDGMCDSLLILPEIIQTYKNGKEIILSYDWDIIENTNAEITITDRSQILM